MKYRRIFPILLILFVIIYFSGCRTNEEAVVSPAGESAVPDVESTATDDKANDTVILTIDGSPIYSDQFTYFLRESLTYIFNSGSSVSWNSTVSGQAIGEYAKQDTISTLKLYRALDELAEERGVSLSDDHQSALDSLNQNGEDEYGPAYDGVLAEQGLTRDIYYYITYISYLYEDLYQSLYGESGSDVRDTGEISRFAEEHGYITTIHVLIYTVDSQEEPLSEEKIAEKREKAEEALAALDNGADIYEVIAQYSESESSQSYTYTTGQMVSAFEDAAFSLEIGEHSGIVDTGFGYYIIYRLPTDINAVWSDYYSFSLFDQLCIEKMNEFSVQATDAFDTLDPQSLFGSLF